MKQEHELSNGSVNRGTRARGGPLGAGYATLRVR